MKDDLETREVAEDMLFEGSPESAKKLLARGRKLRRRKERLRFIQKLKNAQP